LLGRKTLWRIALCRRLVRIYLIVHCLKLII
jgi:hypothetical protein